MAREVSHINIGSLLVRIPEDVDVMTGNLNTMMFVSTCAEAKLRGH